MMISSRFNTPVQASLVNRGALIAVENIGPTVGAYGVFNTIDTKRRFHAVADPPTEHPTRIPVDD